MRQSKRVLCLTHLSDSRDIVWILYAQSNHQNPYRFDGPAFGSDRKSSLVPITVPGGFVWPKLSNNWICTLLFEKERDTNFNLNSNDSR